MDFERLDGRKNNEMRKLSVEVGVLDRADGSAKVLLGKNLAIASVYGPRELHPRHFAQANKAVVRANYRMATFSVDDYKKPFPSRREKEISKVISEAFESVILTNLFPRSVIDVHVQIFQSDGGTRTAAAIAVSAALADAGVPMRDLTGGIASGIYDDQVLLDLTGNEDNKGTGDMPLLYSPVIDEISLFQLDGMFTFEQFKEAYTFSLDAIKKVVNTIQDALKKKYLTIRDEIGIPEEEVEELVEKEEKLAEELVKEINEEIKESKIQEDQIVSDQTSDETPFSVVEENLPSSSPEGLDQVSTETEKTPSSNEEILLSTDPNTSIEKDHSKGDVDMGLQEETLESVDEPTSPHTTSWFERAKSLEPMHPINKDDESIGDLITDEDELNGIVTKSRDRRPAKDEENDVLRDLEYSEFEEKE